MVDNASGDGSADIVRNEFPAVRLIANAVNANYARATNQALAIAHGDWLLLLNPDCKVLPGSLDALAKGSAGRVAAARLCDEGGATQPSVRGFPEPLPLLYDIVGLSRLFPQSRTFAAYRQRFFDYNTLGPAPQPMASCFLIPRACYNAVGGMDECFPLYFNDVDWCWRCWKARFEIVYVPDAVVIHKGGGTTSKVRTAAIWESHRALLRFYAKHYKGAISPFLYGLVTMLVVVGAWARTKRWGQSLGKDGGDITPEQLDKELHGGTN